MGSVAAPRPFATTDTKPSTTGLGGWTLARLVLVVLLMGLLVVLSILETPGVKLGYHFGMGVGMSLVAALFCLPISRFRNLRSFSKLALVLNLVGFVGQLPVLTKLAREQANVSDDPFSGSGPWIERRAPSGNLTLRVPESWHFETRSSADSAVRSLLLAPDDTAFVWITEKAGDFAPGFTMAEYAESMRKRYSEKLKGSVAEGEPARLGDAAALRFALEGVREGVPVKGYLYVSKGRQDFCHLLVFASPSRSGRLQAMVGPLMENALVE